MSARTPSWFHVENMADVPSPSLLVYPERVEENIRRMITVAGGVERLRPHIKTHKMAELVRMQRALGITKFKCATIAEAEMAAGCGVPDLLLAYQPVGPNVARVLKLARQFPQTKFAVIADDATAMEMLSQAACTAGLAIEVLLDVDCGQHRSGVEPGRGAFGLCRLLAASPGLMFGGLHAYDGHLHDTDPAVRAARCEAAFAPVAALREELTVGGLPVPRVVAGGSPTFPMHARRGNVECSPGTCVFWDAGYATKLPDLLFSPAAILLTRVISKPGGNRLCLDLGHKAVASEMPHPRVHLPALPDAAFIAHSEEHLVVETARANEFKVGDAFYGLPWHICPTVALHSEVVVVRNHRAEERWKVTARDRALTI